MICGRELRAVLVLTLAAGGVTLFAQQPRPFPQPADPRPNASAPAPAQPAPPPPAPQSVPAGSGVPDEASLGVPVYPGAQFLGSYDAGRGQRFYLFGVQLSYADAVTYYRNVLKTRGDELFESPPTHQFELGRFREETMAFPPSVTIKDYTFGGSAGFPNPSPGGQPAQFPTVIQIVPIPAGTPQR